MKSLWAVACAVLVIWMPLVAGGADTVIAENTALGAPPSKPSASLKPPMIHPASAAGSNYKIGPEDILYVSVWENKELTLEVVVRPDGMISVPLVQDVQAEGLTATELADVLYQKLLVYLKEPQVSVIVKQVNAPKIFVIGNVVKPGPYPLRSDMSILQALSLAGGFTQFASPRSIKLVRGLGVKQEVRKINYYRLIDNLGEGNYLLQSGDTIVVP